MPFDCVLIDNFTYMNELTLKEFDRADPEEVRIFLNLIMDTPLFVERTLKHSQVGCRLML